MKKILKIAYDDDIKWISNKQKIKDILENPLSPELFIIFRNESKETDFTFLTNLQGEKIAIGKEIVQIPE